MVEHTPRTQDIMGSCPTGRQAFFSFYPLRNVSLGEIQHYRFPLRQVTLRTVVLSAITMRRVVYDRLVAHNAAG